MNVLICLDHSAASQKAVQHAAGILGKTQVPGLSVTLFHVAELLPEYLLSNHPAPGLSPHDLAEAWGERAKSQGQQLVSTARQTLSQAGIPSGCLHEKLSLTNCLPEAKKIAAALAIIDELHDHPYDVVCIGRRGASQLASSFIGGVAEKVIRECQGKTVWLVD